VAIKFWKSLNDLLVTSSTSKKTISIFAEKDIAKVHYRKENLIQFRLNRRKEEGEVLEIN